MTEDDTFEALCRTPVMEMAKIVAHEINSYTAEKIIKMWITCHRDIMPWHSPNDEWAEIYKTHGWDFEELIAEAERLYG